MNQSKTMYTKVQEYLEHRKSLGFKMRVDGHLLINFAKYADRSGHHGSITTELAVEWARLPSGVSPAYLARRFELIRRLARYQAITDPETEVPPSGFLGSTYIRMKPYIYSDEEIASLIKESKKLPPLGGLRSKAYAALFGLLACTGLRISEALRLTRSDVDLKRGILTVRESKFYKSRLVPLHISATKALKKYAQFRDSYYCFPKSDVFFLSESETPLTYRAVSGTFQSLRSCLGWDSIDSGRKPRIYDLRHTFITRRILEWYKQGIDVHHAIYALSTYVGHVKVTHTYWYITGIPELFAIVAKKFEQFAEQGEGGAR